jgi:hypothetical protein
VKNWIKEKMKSEYMQRQIDIMSNLGMFYIIIIALFAVPLVGAFVVVLIRGVFDFRYIILGTGIILAGVGIYYGIKFFIRLFQKMREDGLSSYRHAREQAGTGESVQLDFFNGLISLSYGGKRSCDALPYKEPLAALLPPDETDPAAAVDPLRQIKDLCRLKDEGVIDEAEFQMLKKKLIRDICGDLDA